MTPLWAQQRTDQDGYEFERRVNKKKKRTGFPALLSPDSQFLDDMSMTKSIPQNQPLNAHSIYETSSTRKEKPLPLHVALDPGRLAIGNGHKLLAGNLSLHDSRPHTSATAPTQSSTETSYSQVSYSNMINPRRPNTTNAMHTSTSLPLLVPPSLHGPKQYLLSHDVDGGISLGTIGQDSYVQPGYSPFAQPRTQKKRKAKKRLQKPTQQFTALCGLQAQRTQTSPSKFQTQTDIEENYFEVLRRGAAEREAAKWALVVDIHRQKDKLPMAFLAPRDKPYAGERAARTILAGVLKTLHTTLGLAFWEWIDVTRRKRKKER